MEDLLASRFKRVEVALATLIESIAKYNPNPIHANDLIAADKELNQGLNLLTTHQSNYARILSLRNTSDALDKQIRETLEHLTAVRKDVISTPLSSLVPNKNPISYTELMSYARRISKFTTPPSYQDPIINMENTDTLPIKSNEVVNKPSHDNKVGQVDTTIVQEQSNQIGKSELNPATTDVVPTSQSTIMTNNSNWHEYLNPRTDKPWTPWPSEETIRRGALASIQILTNQGVDLATFDPERGAELEAERKRVIDEEDRQREVQRMRLDQEQNVHRDRKAVPSSITMEQTELHPPQPKVFQLETFDDDDDDDDDD